MNEENTKVVCRGLSLTHILTVIFVIAKILGYIDWSWWLVLLPSIISVGLSVLILAIILILIIIAAILD